MLADNAHVGYRVRDEIVFYMLNNDTAKLLDYDTAFDYEIAAIDETPLMDVFAANLTETLADKKEKEDK